jgi:hypothetical protein
MFGCVLVGKNHKRRAQRQSRGIMSRVGAQLQRRFNVHPQFPVKGMSENTERLSSLRPDAKRLKFLASCGYT